MESQYRTGTSVVQKISYSHDALIELIIANPMATNQELGMHFGYTKEYISKLKSSDNFRERLYERATEVTDPVLKANLEERFTIVANRALEVLMDKLSQPSEKVSDDLALAAANLAAKAKGIGGFGAKVAPPPVAPPADRIERLAERLMALSQPRAPHQEIVDVEARSVSVAGQARPG